MLRLAAADLVGVTRAALVPEMLRARRTAALTRATLGLIGLAVVLADPASVGTPLLVAVGFAVIAGSAAVQLAVPGPSWLALEESVSPLAALLVVGLGAQRVGVVDLLWLAAVASGVLARGGRMFWVGRAVLLVSLALPMLTAGRVALPYAAFAGATIALLLTCGRVTRELRRMLDQAQWDAGHDGLTGALSRSAFRAGLADAAQHAGADAQLALLLVDLDEFGLVNKTSGHASGDAALVSLVQRLLVSTGERGFVGRLGGDEFGLVISGEDPTGTGERLIADLAAGGHGHPPLAASIGAALIPADGRDVDGLLRAADVALRVAKRSGRRQVSLYAGGPLSGESGAPREELARLIAGDGLAMAVQPIFPTAGGAPHAYETLARFNSSVSTSPLHWFSLAEELGLRDELELACLRAALALFAERPEGSLLSVNLSGRLLLDGRALALLAEPRSLDGLIIEVTENSLLENTSGLHAQITALIARGACFAVDDMGAGYSGLRQITTIRPRYLKLDRSLVSGIDADRDRGALVSALLGYVSQIGSRLVAEGVETAAELETLRALGVELVQGFYLGRPDWPWPTAVPAPQPTPALSAASAD